jgi:hypothetical protein
MTDQVLQVEVVAHVLGSMDHCPQCQVFIDGVGVGQQIHRTDLDSYPPDWMQEWQRLSDLILDLAARYPGRLQIKITDAQSPQGLWLALRRGVRRYPTFLVAGEKYHGFEQSRVEELISRHL